MVIINKQIVEIKLIQFLDSIYLSLQTKNWLSALALTLAIPDICGKLENPSWGSQKRYLAWVDKFFIDKYTSKVIIDGKQYQHLISEDLYALRCSYLHSGESEFSKEQIRRALNYIQFTAPNTGTEMHLNTILDQLQIRIDIFCIDMINSVLKWLNEVKENQEINDRAVNLLSLNVGSVPFVYKNFKR